VSSQVSPRLAVTEVLNQHGIVPDRWEILQDGNTLVLRLSETLVARVVQDLSGPRQGTEWFERENALAQYLTEAGAPVIPLHPALPPGPHVHLGYPMNFWQYVHEVPEPASAESLGATLKRCHSLLRAYEENLPSLAIMTESLAILNERQVFDLDTRSLLKKHLVTAMEALRSQPQQVLHGDAHVGNFMNTTRGLLLTDWEDAFMGPVEWDVASLIWNARLLDKDHAFADAVVKAYGAVDEDALQHCLIARAVVMTAWYPILYPNPNEDRQRKLQKRLDWLHSIA
jgi:hypothetical protein